VAHYFLKLVHVGLALVVMFVQAAPVCSQSSTPIAKAQPALYEFGAGYCTSCKEMEKVMAELKASHGDQIQVRMIYAGKEDDLFKQYKVMLIPTQVFLNAEGKEVFRHMGPLTKDQVLQKLRELKFIR
jgi:thioredoxin 1